MHKSRVQKSAKVIVSIAFTINLVICLLSISRQYSAGLLLVEAAFSTPTSTSTTTSSSVSISSIDGQDVSSASSRTQTPNQHRQDRNSSLLQTVSHKSPSNSRQFGDMINDIQIECNSDNIVVTLNTNHGFNGMIYPKGLSKNSTCMMEYHQTTSNITYYLPLRSCNTMSSDVEDGVEYFNTVMVQPHRRLVTNQGRGYHIRCRYQTKERTITNQEQQLSVNLTHSTPSVVGSATMPSCTMKIYSTNDLTKEVAAENVRIGDELNLVISLDDQDVYGMLVTNCLVRDGMNWGEQPLLDDHGCPVDEEIMPQFVYNQNLTRATVTFQAHKFPYTSSVYYQCNVRLCFREGGCRHVPPNCNAIQMQPLNSRQRFRGSGQAPTNDILGSNALTAAEAAGANSRRKRWVDAGEIDGVGSEDLLMKSREAIAKSMSIEVYSGLHVDEGEPLSVDSPPSNKIAEAASLTSGSGEDGDPLLMAASGDNDNSGETTVVEPETVKASGKQQAGNRQRSEKEFCLSLRKFAIAISLASLLLMIALIIIFACLLQKRKRRKLEEQQYQQQQQQHNMMYGNSPYTNRAYCRD